MAVLLIRGVLIRGVHLLQVGVEPIQTAFPNLPVALHPLRDVLQGTRLDAAMAELCIPAACDQPGPFEHAQVLRDGWHAHVERLGQFRHGRLAGQQAGEDGPPGGIGECGECGTQVVTGH
jgi:hypothetical protein